MTLQQIIRNQRDIPTSTKNLHRRLEDSLKRRLCRVSLLLLLGLLPLTGTLDESAEITDGDLEGEVERGEHDGEEDPPATHVGDESECTGGDKTFRRSLSVSGSEGRCGRVTISDGKVPVCTSQAAESEDESEEDQGENDVGSERADEVNQTQHAHKDEEEACC
jgi:hypothetical protein